MFWKNGETSWVRKLGYRQAMIESGSHVDDNLVPGGYQRKNLGISTAAKCKCKKLVMTRPMKRNTIADHLAERLKKGRDEIVG